MALRPYSEKNAQARQKRTQALLLYVQKNTTLARIRINANTAVPHFPIGILLEENATCENSSPTRCCIAVAAHGWAKSQSPRAQHRALLREQKRQAQPKGRKGPLPQGYFAAHSSAMVHSNASLSKGFERCSSIPASLLLRLSSSKALAVMAMMGTDCESFLPHALMARVAS